MSNAYTPDADAITWEEPPPRSTRTERYDALTETLRTRPGQWARVPDMLYTSASSTASAIRAGLLSAFEPKGAYEAAVRKGVLYARYVGPATSGRRIA